MDPGGDLVIPAARELLDLTAVLGTLTEQEERGHTATSDRDLPLAHFRNELVRRSQELDVILPGDRQNLDVGYRRAARLAAFAIATMRRIRHEQAQQGSTDK